MLDLYQCPYDKYRKCPLNKACMDCIHFKLRRSSYQYKDQPQKQTSIPRCCNCILPTLIEWLNECIIQSIDIKSTERTDAYKSVIKQISNLLNK